MRILHVVTRSHRRGAETVAVELADELDARGHENRVVALAPADDGRADAALPPLVHHIGLPPPVQLLCAWRLRRLLASDPVDVVVGHGGVAAQVAALAVPRHRTLLVWQRIHPLPAKAWRPARRRLLQSLASRVDAAVALSPDLERELRRIGFAGPVWLIPNARRPDRFVGIDATAEAARLRHEVHVDDDVALVGFIGHLVDQKRPERAVDVLARLHDRGERVHLVVAGDGPLHERVARDVHCRGLEDHVSFLGHRDDIEHVLGGLDVLLLTSDSEGVPGVAIEAAMAGCPVVTFPVGGVGEVVEDGVTGIVLDRADTALMAGRVAALLHDRDGRRRMGEEARARTSRLSADRTGQMYDDELTRLVVSHV